MFFFIMYLLLRLFIPFNVSFFSRSVRVEPWRFFIFSPCSFLVSWVYIFILNKSKNKCFYQTMPLSVCVVYFLWVWTLWELIGITAKGKWKIKLKSKHFLSGIRVVSLHDQFIQNIFFYHGLLNNKAWHVYSGCRCFNILTTTQDINMPKMFWDKLGKI